MKLTKNTHGGKRPGAGRKPVAVENTVRDAIKKALAEDPQQLTRIWKTVMKKAEGGSDRHAALLFAYHYGRPIESIQVTSKSVKLTHIIVHE